MLRDLCQRAEADGIRLGVQWDGRHVHVTAVVLSHPEIHASACVGGVPRGMECAWTWGGAGHMLEAVNRRAGDPPLACFRAAADEAIAGLDAAVYAYPSGLDE